MLICFHGIDHRDAGELRASLRPAHLEFQNQRNNLVAGPILDADGAMCGSLIIFDADDIADATTQMAGDPYITGDLFQTISITQLIAAEWPAHVTDQ